MEEKYLILKEHYESTLRQHGANFKGMDWPNEDDLVRRFEALTSIMGIEKPGFKQVSLLDLGCGVGLLIDFLKSRKVLDHIQYQGIDISDLMIKEAVHLFPDYQFEVRDILKDRLPAGSVNFVIMNGLLTEKRELAQNEMVDFAKQIISEAWNIADTGIAFNVMSTHVDWKRDDLFHWELDEVADFLVKNCSRNIRIYMDYGLREYTVHVVKR